MPQSIYNFGRAQRISERVIKVKEYCSKSRIFQCVRTCNHSGAICFDIYKLCSPSVYICFVSFSQTTVIPLNVIKTLDFVTETHCGSSEVGFGFYVSAE